MHTLLALALVLLSGSAAGQSRPAGGMTADVAALSAAASNEARFEALTALLRARNVPFTVEPFTIPTPVGREPRTAGRNIVATLGEGPDLVIVGAHYDAARLPDGTLSRGAVDNAASSVILVRLAESLLAGTPAVRIRFVWFDMEELGLLGSAQYLQRHAGERVTAMLNFDVNAYGDTVLYGPTGRREHAGLVRRLVETCASEAVPCVAFPIMPPGDDRSFVGAGIPTLSIAALPAVEAHQLWLMMNGGAEGGLAPGTAPAIMRTIHTPADTPEKVNEATMSLMLRFGRALVRKVAGD